VQKFHRALKKVKLQKFQQDNVDLSKTRRCLLGGIFMLNAWVDWQEKRYQQENE
jgi:hypothetical protein